MKQNCNIPRASASGPKNSYCSEHNLPWLIYKIVWNISQTIQENIWQQQDIRFKLHWLNRDFLITLTTCFNKFAKETAPKYKPPKFKYNTFAFNFVVLKRFKDSHLPSSWFYLWDPGRHFQYETHPSWSWQSWRLKYFDPP